MTTTKIQLSDKQARDIVVKLYTAHYTYNGDMTSHNKDIHVKNQLFVLELFKMPIGTEVLVQPVYRSGKGVSGYTKYIYMNAGRQPESICVYRDGTDTAKRLIDVFIAARNYGHFR